MLTDIFMSTEDKTRKARLLGRIDNDMNALADTIAGIVRERRAAMPFASSERRGAVEAGGLLSAYNVHNFPTAREELAVITQRFDSDEIKDFHESGKLSLGDLRKLPGYRRLHKACADPAVDACVRLGEIHHPVMGSAPKVQILADKPYKNSPDARRVARAARNEPQAIQ